jgi:DNA-binding transcriptional MerR regulator
VVNRHFEILTEERDGDTMKVQRRAVGRLEDAGMLAGGVARKLGIGVQTLHYYEREELIPPPPRTEGGYRIYDRELVERVSFIRKAQALGLPLGEIRDVLRLAEHGACPCGRVQRVLADKLADVDRRLRELRSFRRDLAALVGRSSELSAHSDDARICAIVEEATVPAVRAPATRPLARRRA